MGGYSIWWVQCSQASAFPRSGLLYGQHNSGTLTLAVGYLVIEGEGHLALVDTGYDAERSAALADRDGMADWHGPDELLRYLGRTPSDVDTILVTHAHYDHIGNIGAFPNAMVYLQADELRQWTNALALPETHGWLRSAIDPIDIRDAHERVAAGRLRLVEGISRDVLPGIDLMPAHETHTPGSQYVLIRDDRTGELPWVAAGDLVFTYVNIEGLDGSGRYVPLGFATGSQRRVLDTFDEIMAVVQRRTDRVIPGHDTELWARFPSRQTARNLRIVELALREGEPSRLGFVP